MSSPVVEDRLNALERELAEVKVELARVAAKSIGTQPDWLDVMEGSMSEYPEFDAMVRLGREYRKSFHPAVPGLKFEDWTREEPVRDLP